MDNFSSESGNNQGKSFADLFNRELEQAIESIKPGRIIKGKVIDVEKDFIHVDINYKSIGVIPKEQFLDINQELTVKVDDIVDVYIVALENDKNELLLSHERANQMRIWKEVEDKFTNGGILTGRVQHKVKGGLQVDIGIPAFLPGSQVDLKPHKNLDRFIGEIFDFRVLKITKDKGNIVVSRRAVLMEEREALRGETLKALGEGVVMEGVVKNLTDYGAFVDLGGIDGLLHVTDVSWGHIDHPGEKLSVGQKIAVVVTSYDEEKERVSLGMKQLTDDPWEGVNEKFHQGQKITGKVLATGDFGIRVEFDEGIDGFVPIDNISWFRKIKNLSKKYKKGSDLEVVVVDINEEERRIVLSVKHLEDNPWDTLAERYPIGSKITGPVRSITDFGVFVGVEDGIDGLIHLTDVSWTQKYNSANDLKNVFKKGQDYEAVVLDIQPSEERLSLGYKQLSEDPWPQITQRYPVGTKVDGKVVAVAEYGVFVELEEGIQGMVHKTELGIGKKAVSEAFKVGQDITCFVISVESDVNAERRISLSVKEARKHARKEAIANFNDDSAAPTFGDLIKEKLSE